MAVLGSLAGLFGWFNSVVYNAARDSGWKGIMPLHAALVDYPELIDAPYPKKGRTPLHAAVRSGSAEAVQLLIDRGSQSVDTPDYKGRTPLHYAAILDKVRAVGTLLRVSIQSIDTPDNDGWTPLHHAVNTGNFKVEMVEALLRAGSQSLNTPDNNGKTPLHYAAIQGRIGTVQTLLRAGADPTIGITDEQRLKLRPAIQQVLANVSQPISSSAAQSSTAPSSDRLAATQQQSGSDSSAVSEVDQLRAQLRAAQEQLAARQERNMLPQEQLVGEQEWIRQLQADNIRLQGENEQLVERVRELEREVRESLDATSIVAVYRQWGVERTIYTKRSGEVPVFRAVGPKRSGTALGTMYEEEGTGRRWLGKVGNPSEDNVVGLTQRDTYRRLTKLSMNFDAIQEKLAYDLFEHLGDGRYRVPDSLMSEQLIIDQFTRTHPIALAWAADQQLAHEALGDRDLAPDEQRRLSNESLRLMTEFMDGYSDFRNARCAADDEQVPIDFVAYIERYHRPPDHLLTPDGRRVPLSGLTELLAVGRLLADVDLIGGSGMNAGYVWTRTDDSNINGALTVKIDPGMSFKFGDDSGMNWVRNTRYALQNSGFRCGDARDLQVAAQNTAAVIHWAALSDGQRRSFLQALAAAQRKLQHGDVMEFLLYRHGRYNRSTMEMVPYPTIARWTHDFRQWNELQAELYATDIAALQ